MVAANENCKLKKLIQKVKGSSTDEDTVFEYMPVYKNKNEIDEHYFNKRIEKTVEVKTDSEKRAKTPGEFMRTKTFKQRKMTIDFKLMRD